MRGRKRSKRQMDSDSDDVEIADERKVNSQGPPRKRVKFDPQTRSASEYLQKYEDLALKNSFPGTHEYVSQVIRDSTNLTQTFANRANEMWLFDFAPDVKPEILHGIDVDIPVTSCVGQKVCVNYCKSFGFLSLEFVQGVLFSRWR